MAKPYAMDLRDRAVRFVLAGESRHVVARRLGLGASTVIRWLDRHQKTGTAAPAKFGGYRQPKIIGAYRDWLVQRIDVVILPFKALLMNLKGAV